MRCERMSDLISIERTVNRVSLWLCRAEWGTELRVWRVCGATKTRVRKAFPISLLAPPVAPIGRTIDQARTHTFGAVV